jgi:hypothetical protein
MTSKESTTSSSESVIDLLVRALDDMESPQKPRNSSHGLHPVETNRAILVSDIRAERRGCRSQSVSQSVSQRQLVSQSASQSVSQLVSQSVSQSASQSVNQPVS